MMLGGTIRNSKLMALAAALLMTTVAFAQVAPPPPPEEVRVGAPFTPVQTVYAEDFELSDGGYTTGGATSFEHGEPTSPPVPGTGQGPGMWGTDLDADYGTNECGYVESAPIDLTDQPAAPAEGASLARLVFKHWLHTEASSLGTAWDAGIVMVSADGVDFTIVEPTGGYDRSAFSAVRNCFGIGIGDGVFGSDASGPTAPDDWRTSSFDVTSYLGGELTVRWMFASDGSVGKRGWYIDDVAVQLGVGGEVTVAVPESPTVFVPFTPVLSVYQEDFELDDGGWTATGTGAWEHGEPVSPPNPLPGSLKSWGTFLASDYADDQCAYLTGPSIDVPGADPGLGIEIARLAFKKWQFTENGWDGVVAQASTDGGASWNVLAGDYDRSISSSAVRSCLGIASGQGAWTGPTTTEAPGPDDWLDGSADLTPYMGQTVQVRFVFGSDGIIEKRGFYLDDVVVQLGAGLGEVAVPEPGSAPCLPAPGWTVEGPGSWCYGMDTSGTGSSTPVWGTNLQGDYGPNECSAIVTPAVDTNLIPGLGRLEMSMEHFTQIASSFDGGVVQVTNDGGATWTTVTPVGGYPDDLNGGGEACTEEEYGFADTDTNGYAFRAFNLNSFAGDTIQARFLFGSSGSLEDLGWYVRNVRLTRGAGSIPLTAAGGAATAVTDELASKADPALLASLARGVEKVEVILTGPAHEGLDIDDYKNREEAGVHLDLAAEPFFQPIRAIAELTGMEVVAEWSAAPAIKVVGPSAGLAAMAGLPGVRHMAEDGDDKVRLIEPIPDDGVSASNSEGRQMIEAEEVWAMGFRGEGIVVTVIDTGIDASHEAFKFANGSSRLVKFADCQSSGCDDTVAPYDDHGHGTHVSGTSTGSSLYDDPTFGFFQETGVAPAATMMNAKFLGATGGGSFQGAMDSLQWAFDEGSDITSNSWGGGCSASTAVIALVRQLTDLGMLSVFAAGNSGPSSGTIGGPACGESSLTVGAVDVNENIASFSSRGPCSDPDLGTPSRICPDVVAKGVSVRSAIPRSGAGNSDPSGYKTWQGTSMATPHIAGAVALAEQMKRHFTGSGWDTSSRAEEEVFKLTAKDLGTAGEDNTFGWGLPKLLTIAALLDSTDEARIVDAFGITNPLIRLGESTTLSFSVRNLGGAVASGDFVATLDHPDGAVDTLKSSTVSLGLLDGESMVHTVTVGGEIEPGTYTFTGSFDYSWTNSTTGDTEFGSVLRSGTFDVKRVFIDMTLEGFDETTTSLDLQEVVFTATNTGNEDASSVVVEFTVPDDYVFVPGAGFDPTDANSRYSDPAPDAVVEDSTFGRVTLVFDVGDIGEGESFSFSTNLLPTTPGTYRSLSVAKFQDGSGNGFSQGRIATQEVGLPGP